MLAGHTCKKMMLPKKCITQDSSDEIQNVDTPKYNCAKKDITQDRIVDETQDVDTPKYNCAIDKSKMN